MHKSFGYRIFEAMMKRYLLLILVSLLICPSYANENSAILKEVRVLLQRTVGSHAKEVKLQLISKVNGCDVFEQHIVNGQLLVKGSSAVALSHGFYDFLRTNHYGIVSWSGSRIAWPSTLKGAKTHRLVSPVKHHYYFNVVTYGYTMPYWDWNRWQKEIDWMALHGIDMPLALVANEAITARVWKQLGLTEQEINNYMVGPAHFPWMRMGNISGLDSPLPQSWYAPQVALQHKILAAMRRMGMKPICPGFAGFVPKAINRVYPEAKLLETSWADGAFHNWMLSPQQQLFSRIGKMFIQEWEREFGKCDYYIVDSFNEMDIPFPPKESKERYELLASYGDKVYQSIKAGDKDATWVMQGWMFGYQRDIWDYRSLEALVSKVPDDKMLLLDLAADYNAYIWKSTFNWDFYKGFYGKQWVYSVIPNMGGKSAFTGVLDFYANGHLKALKSANKGNLFAIGMAPEGIENNEVVYELLTDVAWKDTPTDIRSWLKDYTLSRYGTYNKALDDYWSGMLASAYNSFADHPRFNWQLSPKDHLRGSAKTGDQFYRAIESFVSCDGEMKNNPLYQIDLKENKAMYLGGKADSIYSSILQAYSKKDWNDFDRLTKDFCNQLTTIDQLLSSHPTLNLQRWLNFARKWGSTPAEKDYYEKNARRIITVWGPPVNDYSARVWSGLISGYYLPRWKAYFKSLREGTPYNISSWEEKWVEKQLK